MNILILSWRDPKHPNAGGAEQVTLEHAKAWRKAGHEVWWFAAIFKGAKKEERIEGVNVLRSGRQFFDVQVRAFFWYFLGKHPRFDLVVDEFHGIPFFTPLYVRAKKLAFIHEVAKEVWTLNPWPKPFNLVPAFLGPIFEPWVFKLFYRNTLFMTVSESTRDDLISWRIPKKNITVIHNGVDLKALPKKLPPIEKRKTAMFLGALTRDKGIEDAIEAFSLINKSDPSWQFWVLGRGEPKYVNRMKKMSEDFGIKDRIKFWGYVSDKKKFELLARAHVLVNPSIREGWGLVNIEANAVGTPVVGYDVPGLRDSVINERTGFLSETGDARSIAVNVLKLASDKRLHSRLRKGARKWSRNFSWEKASQESLRLIEAL